MNVSHAWLREFVDHPLDARALRDLITERCATVDAVEPLRADLASIVVARVVEAARHPDSDHLSVTKVDAGGQLVDVVCGAPNVTAGKLYPFAPVGTVMPGGLKIEKRKIRGATSQGMLCSARELGLGENHEGILELDLDVAPGTPLLQAMAVGDSRLVIDVTPNRPDLLSHLGVAREVAAATGRPLRTGMPDAGDSSGGIHPPVTVTTTGQAGPVRVTIDDADGCPRYLGAVITGVKVGPSPDWLVARLQAVGSRSINNIVDVTNFMLHGYGQPMHAFDAARLEGSEIVVRRAKAGERLVTLDGTERTLDSSITVIADGRRPAALAGVMGGRDSEVGETTSTVFLEVANFDPARTRATRTKLGLSTDASYRFERGVDIEAAPERLIQAVALIISLAGGRLEGSAVDVYPAPAMPSVVTLRVERVARLLGEPVAATEIVALLRSIGFTARIVPGTERLRGTEEMRVTVPSWRPDVRIEADLIEEIARLRGFGSFPSALRPFRVGTVPDAPLWETADRLRSLLVAQGLFETRPMPFSAGSDAQHVRVANPIAESEGHLRGNLLDTLGRRAEYNLARMRGDVRLFEIGAAWKPGAESMPVETMRVAALIMGNRRPPHFTEPKVPAVDAWDAKGLAALIAAAAFPGAVVELRPSAEPPVLWDIFAAHGQGGAGAGNGAASLPDAAARIGQVTSVSLDAPVWAAPAFGVEIVLTELDTAPVAPPGQSAARSTPLAERGRPVAAKPAHAAAGGMAAGTHVRFKPLPVTPAVELDLALLVPASIAADRVEALIRAQAGELLERLALFDEYQGSGVPAGHRSLAWRLTFRHPERTLRDKEIEGRRDKLLRTLESDLGIRPRAS